MKLRIEETEEDEALGGIYVVHIATGWGRRISTTTVSRDDGDEIRRDGMDL